MSITERCENCGCFSRSLAVEDGVLTCIKCQAQKKERFWNTLRENPSFDGIRKVGDK